jgi:hypothetical protein
MSTSRVLHACGFTSSRPRTMYFEAGSVESDSRSGQR